MSDADTPAPEFYRARETFIRPGPQVVKAGTLVSDDDPRYLAAPDKFLPVAEEVERGLNRDVHRRDLEDVEQATAAPGERRSLGRRRRGKAAAETVEPPAEAPAATSGGDPGPTTPGDGAQDGSGDGSGAQDPPDAGTSD